MKILTPVHVRRNTGLAVSPPAPYPLTIVTLASPSQVGSAAAEAAGRASPAGRLEILAIVLLAVALAAALVYQAWHVGVTVDEPSHLVSSYLYWRGADILPPRDMPPMIKIAGGAVPNLFGLPLKPTVGTPAETRNEWEVAAALMERLRGPEIHRIFFWSRLPMIVFPLLTMVLLWRWARQLFRPWTAVALAAAFAAEPTALAHGALFKNDLAATMGYLLFWYCAWRYWREPGTGRAAILGAATLAAAISKLSMIFLFGAAPLVVLLRAFAPPRPKRRAVAAALALAVLIPYLGTLTVYQFDTRRIPAPELAAHAKNPNLPAWFIAGAHIFHVVPVAVPMWDGVTSLFNNHGSRVPVYMLGKVYPHGTPLYFLVALAVKVPLPLQVLLCAGLVLALAGLWTRRLKGADLFWIVPGILYVGLASLSSLQLGVRLVLPALPFGLLLCGVAIERFRGWRRVFPAALVVWVIVRSAAVYPNGIAYMNLWAGGPENALHYLADSNVDWGQSLADLARWKRAHGIKKLRLSYFGNDNPFRYFREEEVELVAPPWSEALAPQPTLVPQPGWYAISATLLPGQFFEPRFQNYYRVFRRTRPVALAGNSIYIYKVGS